MKTNITLKLDTNLLREAKILAAGKWDFDQCHAGWATGADGA